MEKKSREIILDIIGIFFIVIPVLRLFFLEGYETFPQFFWLCNHVPIIMGIAILLRSSFWLNAELSLLFAGMLLWVIDFLLYFLSGFILFDSAMYIFNSAGTMFFYLSTLIHLLVLPLSIFAVFLLKKPEPRAWLGSIAHGFILAPIMIYLGSDYNINFFLRPTLPFVPDFFLYPLIFSAFYLGIFVIPVNLIITKILESRKNR